MARWKCHPIHNRALRAYRSFIARAPRVAKEQPLAQRFLSLLDHEWLELRASGTQLTPRPIPPANAAQMPAVSLKAAADAFDQNPGASTSSDQAAAVAPVAVRKAPVPVYKKWWLWTAVGGGVAIALGIGLGVGLSGEPGACSINPSTGVCE